MSTIEYRIVPSNPSAHLYLVQVTVPEPDPDGQVFDLPAWIPGSYLVREFSKNIVTLCAEGPDGPVPMCKRDKHTWVAGATKGPLVVSYEVYAWDLSVRHAHLDQTHGFFNGTSTFLRVIGQDAAPCRVTIEPPGDPKCADWRVATSLGRLTGGNLDFGTFEADDYDDLVDHPVEMGTFTHFTFEACGVPHEFAITGRHEADVERLKADLTKICEHHIRFFGEPAPVDRYVFLLTVVGNGYGGLEHRASTALISRRADLPRAGVEEVTDGYRQFLGLCSHEYFHTWNVKRIKPASFLPYDLSQENYTSLLWAFEGITSYYDDLGLLHSGCISVASYLELLGVTATRVRRGSGRLKQSLSESSWDAWTKYYRQDENAPNAIVSYYAKGALAALALDLEIRLRTEGARSLDDVMRLLWERHGKPLVGVPEHGVEAIASEVAGQDLTAFFDQAIRGTEDLPLASLLAAFGVRFVTRARSGPSDTGGKPGRPGADTVGDLGARVVKSGDGARLSNVYDDGAAQAAGLSAGDVVIAADGLRVAGDALLKHCAAKRPGDTVTLHAFRRDELMVFDVTLREPPQSTVYLELDEEADPDAVARRSAWIGC